MATRVDLGQVVGPQGPQGPAGPAGPGDMAAYIVDWGVTKTDNNTQTWYWEKYSNGAVKLYIKHNGWVCHSSDTNTLFKLPFSLPSTNYQVQFSVEQNGSSHAFFTNAFFIVNNKTTSQFNVYCYRSGTVSITLNLAIEVIFKPSS